MFALPVVKTVKVTTLQSPADVEKYLGCKLEGVSSKNPIIVIEVEEMKNPYKVQKQLFTVG